MENLEERYQVFLKMQFVRFLNRKKEGLSNSLDESTSRCFLFYGLPGMGKVFKKEIVNNISARVMFVNNLLVGCSIFFVSLKV